MRIRKDKDVPLTETRSHGIFMPEWVWRIATEGKVRNQLRTRSAFVQGLIINHAKRCGYYLKYKAMVDKKINEELSGSIPSKRN